MTVVAHRGRPGWRRLATPIVGAVANAFAHPHNPDHYIRLIDPTYSSTDVLGRVESVRHPAHGSVTFQVRPNARWAGFLAGQHVQLGVDVDGAVRRRCYSVVTSEHDRSGLLEFTAKLEIGGQVSPRLHTLRPGTVVSLSQAQGPFTLPQQRPDHVVLLGGGSGITPVLAMLRTLVDEGRGHTVTFLHYARSPEVVAYRDELIELRDAGLRVVLHEHDQRFTAEHLADVPDAPTWVCGPAGFVEAVRAGRPGRDGALHVEHFTAPAPVLRVVSDGPTGEITFTASSVSVADTGESLLEQAEAAGLNPAFGCRMGICWTCTRRKTDGPVRDLRSGVVDTTPDTDIQLCVTAPCGDVRIDL